MPIFEADKPPICSPVELAARRHASPDSNAGAESHEESAGVDATGMAARRGPIRGPGTLLHWTFLVMAVVIVAASFVLSVRNGEQVIVPVIDAPLPGTCTFRRMTGVPCPGCGLTRSFISMGHGQIDAAWSYNPAGFFFFAIVAFQIPYRIYQILRIRRGQEQHRFAWIDNWVLIALVLILLVQWTWRLVAAAM